MKRKPTNYRELTLINNSIKTLVKEVRSSLFSKLDAVNQQIIDVLLATDGIVSYQDLKKDQIIF